MAYLEKWAFNWKALPLFPRGEIELYIFQAAYHIWILDA